MKVRELEDKLSESKNMAELLIQEKNKLQQQIQPGAKYIYLRVSKADEGYFIIHQRSCILKWPHLKCSCSEDFEKKGNTLPGDHLQSLCTILS